MLTSFHRTCWIATILLLTAAAIGGIARGQSNTEDEYYELMRVFVDTFEQIDRNYVKEVDRRKLIEGAVRGMLAELDPYSDYIAPDDLDHFTEAISQEFGGIGIRVNPHYNAQVQAIEVMTPLPGSPAYEAGVHAGDHIVEIAGKPVKEFPSGREIDTAIEMLRGKPGESVEMTVKHAGSDETEKITIVRDLIQLDTVLGYMPQQDGSWDFMLDEEEKIGYMRITHFTSRTADEVREVLKALKKEGMQGLIIDLRFNPGGLLQAAVDICDLFLEEGLIVSTKGRNSLPRNWAAKSFGTFTGFPVAIIVNHYSASASEIVAACLQDHHRAIIVGERSWGKGSVQDVIDLEEGKSALKLTTATYHRPSGKNIHKDLHAKETDEWGVIPDEGYLDKYTLEDWEKFQKDRRARDAANGEPFESDYVDRHLEAARKYIKEQIRRSEAGEQQSEVKKQEEEQPAPQKDKKAAGRLPLFRVPRQPAA